MAKPKSTRQPSSIEKPRHHRTKKLAKLVLLAGAVYGAKKLWDRNKKATPPADR